ncbi:NAD(P)-binding protein [Gymnopus androsaceus JB14]|uniref:NAD(P)-binding protein n=1 Tax=Gymnopus androsaceus JB14 TaxID=1447944 RepID=A0A6A4HAA5_9AGAR|nr:NAD(P)-binding protein [Gymnopus androsaceus JB14]
MAPSISAIRALNASFSPSYLPVAVFVGGTSGIGQGMAEAFARSTNGNAHIIIIGRNSSAAEAIIAGFPRPTSPSAKHEFLACDVTLMKNVQRTTQELLSRTSRINFLVMTPGLLTLSGRDETEEGIDKKLAVHYYARWKFIHGLVPALVQANEAGEDSKVFSVLAAGMGGKINLEDLGLKKTFSLANAALATPTYNDLMMEEYASRYPSLTFCHAYPGTVRTNLGSASPSSIIRIASTIATSRFSPLSYLATSQEAAGEYLLNGLLNTASRPGAWRIDNHGNDIGKTRYFGDEESRKKLWEHSAGATESAEASSA